MRRLLVIGLLAAGAAAGGCGTVARQTYYGATGASARYSVLRSPGGPGSLDRFTTVSVGLFEASLMPGAIPAEVPPMVQTAILLRLMETKAFARVERDRAARTGLLVRGRFHDYDNQGSALRAVGFGTDPFLTAQVELVDAASGRVLGLAMVTGTVKSAVRTGHRELADGLAKAVRGLLAQYVTRLD